MKTSGIRYAHWNGSLMAVSVFLLHASYCITVWAGTDLVYSGQMNPGVVITVTLTFFCSSKPSQVLITIMLCIGQLHIVTPLFTKINRAKVAAELLYQVIDRVGSRFERIVLSAVRNLL